MPGDLAAFPQSLLALIRKAPQRSPAPVPAGVLMTEAVVDAALEIVDSAEVVAEGDGSDEATLQVCLQLRDLGLSETQAVPYALHFGRRCAFDAEWVKLKLRNAYLYGRGVPGEKNPEPLLAVDAVINSWRERGSPELEIPELVSAVAKIASRGVTAPTLAMMNRRVKEATGLTERQQKLPKAVDLEQLEARKARASAHEGGDLSLVDPENPLNSARQFLKRGTDAEGFPKIQRWQETWWEAKHHYQPLPDEQVRAGLYNHFDGTCDVRSGAPINPDRTFIETVQHALTAEAQIAGVKAAPAWLKPRPDDMPADEVIAFANGLLHVKPRTFIPRTRSFFTLNSVGFSYDPHAEEPTEWLKFLGQLWPDDPESTATLQELFGLALTGDTSFQKLFLLVGPKRSGKGTVARVLTALVGSENVTAPTLNGIGQHFGLESLIAKTFAVISDARLSARTDLGAVVENLLRISGEDTISVPRKHRSDWTAKLSTRFLIISNELPAFVDQSGALASRFVVLRLTQSFFGREDRALTQRLLEELPGILLWSLDGLDRLQERGHFLQPKASLDMVKQLEDLGSPIKAFVADRCVLAPGATVTSDSLFFEWSQWVNDQGRDRSGSKAMFGRNLSAAFPEIRVIQPRVNGGRERHYEGIGLARDGTRTDPLQVSQSENFREVA